MIGRVLCAQMVNQINIDETPRPPDLGAGDRAGLGAGLQRIGVDAEEVGGFNEVECAHGQAKCFVQIRSMTSTCLLVSMRVSRPASR